VKAWAFLAAFAAMFAAPAAAAPPAAGTYVVHGIDVGTGLAIFVEGHDFALLYDAGSNDDVARGPGNRVVAYLRAVRPDLRVIDHLILSHPHKDHSELMPDIFAAYQVRHVWDSGALNRICSYRALLNAIVAEPGVTYHDALGGSGTHDAAFLVQNCYGSRLAATTIRVPQGSRIAAGAAVPIGAGAAMTFLHADGSRQSSFNENSLVARLDLGSRRVILPGDAEAGGRRPPATRPAPTSIEGELIACCAAALRADILVAGHHGSTTSSRTAFLDAIGATHFVVSGGPTRYGSVTLPDPPVVAELARRGTVWRTDLNDATCGTNRAKIGPDNDGRAGGCDNIRIAIDRAGAITAAYRRAAD
jgi:competence protein ComEC